MRPNLTESEDLAFQEIGIANLRRVSVQFSVDFSNRYCHGTGTVQNISSSGALIEEVDPPLLSGGKIALSFTPFDDSKPIELRATIVRETDTGFAVEFDELDVPTYKILRTTICEAIHRSQEESAAVKRRAAPR